MSDRTEYIVTLAPGTAAGAVVNALSSHGFETTSVLDQLSMIVGLAAPEVAQEVAGVPGVTAVEPSQAITIPPDGPQ